jgi:predicted GNAT superfamily acetyltransferase
VTTLRDASPEDFAAILALNEESVRFTSPLTPERLDALHRVTAYHKVVEIDGEVAAFLLALREGAPYDSPNYRWFAERYPHFLYIDRIVVAPACRGARLGVAFYDDIITFATASGVPWLTCEFDVEPPNPASMKFHERMGFVEVGTQRLGGGKKRVSLQARATSSVVTSPDCG